MTSSASSTRGEPDIARVASAFADPRRARILMALTDGRALPAGRLAQEAGVGASTVSNHLRMLLARELVVVEQQGRHRYYRLARAEVESVLEALAGLAPQEPITSLRQHTRAHALRKGRTCYRHLAGRLGVDLFQRIVDAGWVVGGDGRHHDGCRDRWSAPGSAVDYRLTDTGADALVRWGIAPKVLRGRELRYCLDWTEQAHHLSGPLGAALASRMFEQGWIRRGAVPRSVVVTDIGHAAGSVLLPAVVDAESASG